MTYPDGIVDQFRAVLIRDGLVHIEQGKILYRGGQSDSQIVELYKQNVFLTSRSKYARDYTRLPGTKEYAYMMRVRATRPMILAHVSSMGSVVRAAVALSLTPVSNIHTWQSENMVSIARNALGIEFDGVLFEELNDNSSDEYLIDNSKDLLCIEDIHCFIKGKEDEARTLHVMLG